MTISSSKKSLAHNELNATSDLGHAVARTSAIECQHRKKKQPSNKKKFQNEQHIENGLKKANSVVEGKVASLINRFDKADIPDSPLSIVAPLPPSPRAHRRAPIQATENAARIEKPPHCKNEAVTGQAAQRRAQSSAASKHPRPGYRIIATPDLTATPAMPRMRSDKLNYPRFYETPVMSPTLGYPPPDFPISDKHAQLYSDQYPTRHLLERPQGFPARNTRHSSFQHVSRNERKHSMRNAPDEPIHYHTRDRDQNRGQQLATSEPQNCFRSGNPFEIISQSESHASPESHAAPRNRVPPNGRVLPGSRALPDSLTKSGYKRQTVALRRSEALIGRRGGQASELQLNDHGFLAPYFGDQQKLEGLEMSGPSARRNSCFPEVGDSSNRLESSLEEHASASASAPLLLRDDVSSLIKIKPGRRVQSYHSNQTSASNRILPSDVTHAPIRIFVGTWNTSYADFAPQSMMPFGTQEGSGPSGILDSSDLDKKRAYVAGVPVGTVDLSKEREAVLKWQSQRYEEDNEWDEKDRSIGDSISTPGSRIVNTENMKSESRWRKMSPDSSSRSSRKMVSPTPLVSLPDNFEPLSDWIPRGYGIYVIALQEAVSEKLIQGILEYLNRSGQSMLPIVQKSPVVSVLANKNGNGTTPMFRNHNNGDYSSPRPQPLPGPQSPPGPQPPRQESGARNTEAVSPVSTTIETDELNFAEPYNKNDSPGDARYIRLRFPEDRIKGLGDGAYLSMKSTTISCILDRELLIGPTPVVDVASSKAMSLSPLNGSKGAVALILKIFGQLTCFVSCHLPAGEPEARLRARETIKKQLVQAFRDIPEIEKATELFHHIIWSGDFNFRVRELQPSTVLRKLEEDDLNALLSCDELQYKEFNADLAEEGFQELPITFRPTYKLYVKRRPFNELDDDRFVRAYHVSFKVRWYKGGKHKQRVPSWTDRIFKWSCTALQRCLLFIEDSYTAADPRYSTLLLHSDHAPVGVGLVFFPLAATCSLPPVSFLPKQQHPKDQIMLNEASHGASPPSASFSPVRKRWDSSRRARFSPSNDKSRGHRSLLQFSNIARAVVKS